MFYELFVKLFGAGIAYIIYYLPFCVNYADNTLTVSSMLTQPITQESEKLVTKGYNFKIEYMLNVIVNEQKSFSITTIKTLSWQNGWKVNGQAMGFLTAQTELGSFLGVFPKVKFDNGDIVTIFAQAHILPDEAFTVSTGFKTQVLWKFYIPTLKNEYIFKNGAFIKQ